MCIHIHSINILAFIRDSLKTLVQTIIIGSASIIIICGNPKYIIAAANAKNTKVPKIIIMSIRTIF